MNEKELIKVEEALLSSYYIKDAYNKSDFKLFSIDNCFTHIILSRLKKIGYEINFISFELDQGYKKTYIEFKKIVKIDEDEKLIKDIKILLKNIHNELKDFEDYHNLEE